MAEGLIINKMTKYLRDIKKLKDFQLDFINKISDLICKDPLLSNYPIDSKPGRLHELKQFSHGNWRVISIDVPERASQCDDSLNGTYPYYKGRLKFLSCINIV